MKNNLDSIINDFKSLRSMEAQSGEYYERMLLPLMKSEEDKTIVKGIIADEVRHEKMVDGVVRILEKLN